MKYFFCVFFATQAAFVQADTREVDKQMLNFINEIRPQINAAGQNSDRTKLVQLRESVNVRLARWSREEEASPCRRALLATDAFLYAAIQQRPPATKEELARTFRIRLAQCRKSAQ